MNVEIQLLAETMRNYMTKNARPERSRRHNIHHQASSKTTRDPRRRIKRSKGRKQWSPTHFRLPRLPEESLIASHLLRRSVWPRYGKEVRKVEELRSTTNLRRSWGVRRTIHKLKGHLQDDDGRNEVNSRDELCQKPTNKMWHVKYFDQTITTIAH